MIALISVCESFTPKCEILLSTFAQAWEESCHLTPASFYRSHKRHRYNLIAQVFCGPPLQARRTVFGLEKIVQGFLSLGNLSEYFIAADIARFKKLMCNLREVRRQRERFAPTERLNRRYFVSPFVPAFLSECSRSCISQVHAVNWATCDSKNLRKMYDIRVTWKFRF